MPGWYGTEEKTAVIEPPSGESRRAVWGILWGGYGKKEWCEPKTWPGHQGPWRRWGHRRCRWWRWSWEPPVVDIVRERTWIGCRVDIALSRSLLDRTSFLTEVPASSAFLSFYLRLRVIPVLFPAFHIASMPTWLLFFVSLLSLVSQAKVVIKSSRQCLLKD